MRAVRFEYTADGWGTGEVWVRDGLLVHHELATGATGGGEPADSGGHRRAERTRLAPAPAPVGGRVESRGERPATGAGPQQGGASTPGVTVASEVQQDCVDFVSELCGRFVAHLDGREVDYTDVPIELEWCTPLQRDIAGALRTVAWGEVVSYGELAERAGRPRAPRAAGSFCAQNQLQLVLPCHRVIAADGIGGYGASGVGLKRRLLALEGVEL